jgi:hypothetical protein
VTDFIQTIAFVAQSVVAIGALIAFGASRVQVLVHWVAHAYASEITIVLRHVRRRAIARRLVPRIRDRVIGADSGLVRAELDEISALDPTVGDTTPIPWDSRRLLELADAYDRVSRRLQRSVLLRLRSNDLIVRESALAVAVAQALRRDADYHRSVAPEEQAVDASARALRELLDSINTRLLVEPPSTASGSFASVRATLIDREFGVPARPFGDIARGSHEPSDWAPASPGLAAALDAHARALAARSAAEGGEYNGVLARVVGWRREQSRSSAHQRLHLLVERTNFLSLIATNGRLESVPDALRAQVIEASLRNHLDDPHRSATANALAVHLVIVSSDRKLVLTQRSESVKWAPGQLNTAVNGVVELAHHRSTRPGDTDANGFPDLAHAALREADEELGTHLCLEREVLVVRCLALDDRPDQITPYVVFEARSPATFDEIATGHFARVSRHEGAFEVGEHLLGIPIEPDAIRATVPWLRHCWDTKTISASGLATTLLTFARVVKPVNLLEVWNSEMMSDRPSVVERRAV